MPRLPFRRGFRALTALIALAIVAAPVSSVLAAAGPTPRITAIGVRGQAPYAIHVHGLTSTLNAGDESTARYEWTFGDASGAYNTLVGWNAAHIYNTPGTYTVTLKLTNASRETANATLQIIVDPPARGSIYVSPSGNDANSGTTTSAPVRTLARAQTLMGSNKAMYLQRGAVFTGSDMITVDGTNELVSAYGSGPDPIIMYDNPTLYTKIVQINSSARDAVIENLVLDSQFTPDNTIVRGVSAHGTNITVRNCHFGKISYAIATGGGSAFGLLTQNNVAGAIGAYYCWGEGTDHTHLGNTVADSIDEHNIRLGGCSRVLIAYNSLTNTNKSSIWCMLGDHAYVYGNKLHTGRLLAGPNFAVTSPGETFPWVVAEANEFFDAQAIMYDGAENVTLRNNIMHADGLEAISVWGYAAVRDRTTRNITLANNTVINNSNQYGKFTSIGAGSQNVMVVNNIYDAPLLNAQNGSNTDCDDSALTGQVFQHNIWSNPKVGSRWHVMAGSGLNASAWDALTETLGEINRTFATGDLSSSFLPTFNASIAAPVAGVFTDFQGNIRPATGTWVAGAVEAPGSAVFSGDLNNDGIVDVSDMLIVLTSWGACGSCRADANHDGVVDVGDFLIVVSEWG